MELEREYRRSKVTEHEKKEARDAMIQNRPGRAHEAERDVGMEEVVEKIEVQWCCTESRGDPGTAETALEREPTRRTGRSG